MASSADSWVKEYEQIWKLSDDLANSISKNTLCVSEAEGQRDLEKTLRGKIFCLWNFAIDLDPLTKPAGQQIEEEERNRRAVMLNKLKSKFTQMATTLNMGSLSGSDIKPTIAISRTIGLDKLAVVGQHRQFMREQDEGTGKLEEAAINAKHSALAVNKELDLDIRLLDGRDEHMDVTDSEPKVKHSLIEKDPAPNREDRKGNLGDDPLHARKFMDGDCTVAAMGHITDSTPCGETDISVANCVQKSIQHRRVLAQKVQELNNLRREYDLLKNENQELNDRIESYETRCHNVVAAQDDTSNHNVNLMNELDVTRQALQAASRDKNTYQKMLMAISELEVLKTAEISKLRAQAAECKVKENSLICHMKASDQKLAEYINDCQHLVNGKLETIAQHSSMYAEKICGLDKEIKASEVEYKTLEEEKVMWVEERSKLINGAIKIVVNRLINSEEFSKSFAQVQDAAMRVGRHLGQMDKRDQLAPDLAKDKLSVAYNELHCAYKFLINKNWNYLGELSLQHDKSFEELEKIFPVFCKGES